ncbi:hypothetical protein SRHO_G00326180 [Serrasalmus rhombeus]
MICGLCAKPERTTLKNTPILTLLELFYGYNARRAAPSAVSESAFLIIHNKPKKRTTGAPRPTSAKHADEESLALSIKGASSRKCVRARALSSLPSERCKSRHSSKLTAT